jgi:TolB-like protein/DNA-binding winged helix-turn-helix (wHTH) protein/Flp pilus assembly protein TadD
VEFLFGLYAAENRIFDKKQATNLSQFVPIVVVKHSKHLRELGAAPPLQTGKDMKFFQSFRLDTANHCLWRDEERVAIAPKAYDVLRYLVENPERLVPQEELLEKLWPETYVNPEGIRKYILEIRKVLGDRLDKPQFIETMPKRGYRFVASVRDADVPESSDLSASHEMDENTTEPNASIGTSRSKEKNSSPRRALWKLAIAPVLAAIAAVAIGAHLRSARSGVNAPSLNNASIAVLPFTDMSPAKDQEYFPDGLSEQLIHDLARISGLKVLGRSSAFQFKGKNQDLREVGRKLGVANVLEGSVRREGNHLRITAELVKADDGFELWSQTYDREISDIFAVQDEIARAATEALQVRLLGGNGQPVVSNLHSANPEAYQAYLQANYFLGRGTSKEDIAKALAYTDTAIRLDERYAPAWALRSTVEEMMAQYSFIDVTEGFRKSREDAERAIMLDPTSASGYLARARTQIGYDWDWDAANTSLTKAAALEPGSVEVLRIRSVLSRALGNLDGAVKLADQAVALDPLRANSQAGLAYHLYVAGRYQEARAALQKALDLNPQVAFAHATLCKILLAEGKPQQALTEIEKEPNDWEKLTDEALVYHALGREQDSKAALAELIAKHSSDSAYQIAQVYAFRGEPDKSFSWLERAYKQRDPGITQFKCDPRLKDLRHDARFADLLKKMHLPA